VLVALALLSGLAYKFPVGSPIEFHLTVSLDGYLPLLGVGEGKAKVEGTFEVVGKDATTATSSLKAFSVTFNEGKLPLDLDDAKAYFPDGKFGFTPEGKMTKWDGVGKAAPIRFPGIDVEHFPELVYLPLEWVAPSGADSTFTREMSGGKVEWHFTPQGDIEGSKPRFAVTLIQTFSSLEDTANQVVKQEDAVARVETRVTGKGTLVFDRVNGRVDSLGMDEESVGQATDLTTKQVTTRKLKIRFEVTTS
jgi:hypothetical protein